MTDMTAKIKVIGVGGGGSNAVHNMLAAELHGVEFVCANTDAQALARASAGVTKVQIGDKLTKGLGAGANPQVGRDAATESLIAIKETIGDADMIFVTAGMGGGTGTGAAPIVAQAAKEMGILTVGVVTRPFLFEGDKRRKAAEQGIAELRQHVDSLIIIPNDRLLTIAPKNAKLMDMFLKADDVLHAAVRGISDLITRPGYINLDFADVKTAMGESGYAMMGAGCASGEGRAVEAARMAITSPLLEDVSIAGAKAVLINVTANHDIGMDEYSEALYLIQEAARGESGDANIFIGMAFDENAGDDVRITVIATGIDAAAAISQPSSASGGAKVSAFPSFGQNSGQNSGQHAAQNNAQNSGYEHASRGHHSEQSYGGRNANPASGNHNTAFEEAPARSMRTMRTPQPMPPSGEQHDFPAFLRTRNHGQPSQASVHAPGRDDFIFGAADDESYELPTFIRKQAN